MDQATLVQMAYALGIGLLIGLERSMTSGSVAPGDGSAEDPDPGPDPTGEPPRPAPSARTEEPGDNLGVRTFSVLSVVGFGAALAGERIAFIPPAALMGVCALLVAMYLRARERGPGITTEASALGVCVLGMLCRHQPEVAGALALVVTMLLAAKRLAHETAARMRRVELIDTIKFLVIILIILPMLPDRTVDPYGIFNPYKVGFLVVLISGISFVGYFLTRILGAQRGLGITGILGGLTSSTAVTAAMATEARRAPELLSICAFSTVAANATMFVRVLVVVGVLDRPLAFHLAWAVGTMSMVAAVAALLLWARASKGERGTAGGGDTMKLKNPFSIVPALKFGGFFVGILFAAKVAKDYLGHGGIYAAAAVSGLADVDAITLTIAEQTQTGDLDRTVGAAGVIIAVVSNSVVKSCIAIYQGGWRFGRTVGISLGLATLAGLAVVLYQAAF